MINTTDGYTLILGGIGLLYAGEGQSVLAGETRSDACQS